MTLLALLKLVSAAYPENAVMDYVGARNDGTIMPKRGLAGDSLAFFIACELIETFDPEADTMLQLAEAHRVMSTAAREVEDVRRAIAAKLEAEP